MQNVLPIIAVSIRKLLAKKTVYALLFVFLLILGLMGSQLFGLLQSPADNSVVLKVSLLAQIMGVWAEFSTYLIIIYAAGAIQDDLKTKSILGVMAKPITRGQFLLGRWLGVVTFSGGFVLTGAILMLILMAFWNISVTSLLIIGICAKFVCAVDCRRGNYFFTLCFFEPL